MKEPSNLARPAAVLLIALALINLPALAADEGWKDTAELSLVTTSGNSEGTTFGFKNKLWRKWDKSGFELKAGGIRVDSTNTTRFATGLTTFGETEVEETTAESYYLNGRFDREITERFFWYTSLGWDRNKFAGVQNRYSAAAGVGNIWVDTDDRKFRTDYALTYTDQEDVVDNPLVDDTFAGLRLSWDYMNKLGQNSTYTNTLVLDGNLDETDDYRADMINSLAVSMSERMAIKLSLQWLYDNLPSADALDASAFGNPGDPGCVPSGGSCVVLAELDDLDQIFTASLVINF